MPEDNEEEKQESGGGILDWLLGSSKKEEPEFKCTCRNPENGNRCTCDDFTGHR